MSYPLMMRKTDYAVMPYSQEQIDKYATHVGITLDQYRFLNQDPKANGPRLFHFIVVSNGMADDARNAAFMDMLRAEQKKVDDAATAAEQVAQVSEPAPAGPDAPAADDTPPAPLPAEDPYSVIQSTFDAMKTKDELVDYCTKTLGLKVDKRMGKNAIIKQAIADMKARDAEVG